MARRRSGADATAITDDLVPVGVVELETGIPRETLRIWERRYGVPCPARSSTGIRHYSADEIGRLRLAKQLIDRGYRPGDILGQSDERLRALANQLVGDSDPDEAAASGGARDALALLRERRISEFRAWLRERLVQQGLRRFVLDVARPLCTLVGIAWERGEAAIYQEHIASQMLQQLLQASIHNLATATSGPDLLLTTLPGEPHAIGLLMVEALLTLQGARCLSLGAQTPISEIATCCRNDRFDAVVLSFSAGFSSHRARRELRTLRDALDEKVEIWAGGSGVARYSGRRVIDGVKIMGDLEQISPGASRK